MKRKNIIFITQIFSLTGFVLAGPIEDLKPGEWYEVPNSNMIAVMPCKGNCGSCDPVNNPNDILKEHCNSIKGTTGFDHIMGGGWNGGAYDIKRDRLIVWGGGHHGYGGGELYAFDLNTLQWLRVTEPGWPEVSYDSQYNLIDPNLIPSLGDTGYYPKFINMKVYPPLLDKNPDGTLKPDPQKPRARHTYEMVEYVPSMDRFCSVGVSGPFPYVYARPYVDCFDFDSKTWERKANTPTYYYGTAAYDSVKGQLWARGTNGGTNALSKYDHNSNQWAMYANESNWSDKRTGEIDPKRQKYVIIGQECLGPAPCVITPSLEIWDLNNPNAQPKEYGTTATGATEIMVDDGPGLAYDPVSDRMVAWKGGPDVYALDMNAQPPNWTKHPPAAGWNTNGKVIDANGLSNAGMTFGRFRYSPNKNVYVVVNSVFKNVFIYKLNPGGGLPPDTMPPAAPTGLKMK